MFLTTTCIKVNVIIQNKLARDLELPCNWYLRESPAINASHIKKKGRGCWSEILKRPPRSYQDPVFWGWLEIFSILRDTNSYITHYLLSYFFSAQYPKTYRKSSHCGPFEAEHSKRYQNRAFTPPRNQSHVCSFALVFFVTFIALFSNGYKYHTWWYPKLFCTRFSVNQTSVCIQRRRSEVSAATCPAVILEILGKLIFLWTWIGPIESPRLFLIFPVDFMEGWYLGQ